MKSEMKLISDLELLIGLNLKRVNHIEISGFKNAGSYSLSSKGRVIGLNLQNLKFKSFPDLITSFKKLQVLNFNDNIINNIPSSLSNLKELKRLSLSQTGISNLYFLRGLENIEVLSLRGNEISTIEDFGFLKSFENLKKIDLRKNELTHLPSWLFEFPMKVGNSEAININNNPIIDPPQEIILEGKEAVLNYFKKNRKKVKLFLSHSSDDKPVVRLLYSKILSLDYVEDVWFDEKKFHGGEKFQLEIEKEIKNSDLFLLCLSEKAMDEKGFFHKEFKFAVEKALNMSESDTFIIPLKLDDCTIPKKISNLIYIDLRDSVNFKRLEKVIQKKWKYINEKITHL